MAELCRTAARFLTRGPGTSARMSVCLFLGEGQHGHDEDEHAHAAYPVEAAPEQHAAAELSTLATTEAPVVVKPRRSSKKASKWFGISPEKTARQRAHKAHEQPGERDDVAPRARRCRDAGVWAASAARKGRPQ